MAIHFYSFLQTKYIYLFAQCKHAKHSGFSSKYGIPPNRISWDCKFASLTRIKILAY